MSVTQPVIHTEDLTKSYGRKLALSGLNLSVQPGEIFGYLGPNGAGKTTTIRLLLDFIRPTSGNAHIFGQNANTHPVEIHRRIGYLPSELALWENLTGTQIIDYVGSVRGGVDKAYVRQLSERLDLNLTVKMRSYSTGNKRKLGIVLALMNQPDLLIMDEPTNGLDPLVQQTFHEMMKEARAAGRTVFLSSHVLSEVQAICDRVAILRDGQLRAVERVTDLTHAEFRWVTIRTDNPAAAGKLTDVPGASEITVQENQIRLRLKGDFDPLLRALDGQYIRDIRTESPTLEEIFLTYYGDSGTTARDEQKAKA